MEEKRAFELIAESLEVLKETGGLANDVITNRESILLGPGSPLDSIGFVTFVTDLEERISEETDKDLYLVLNEISEFDINKPYLASDTLAKYIVKLSQGE